VSVVKDADPGEYVVTEVREGSGNFRYGIFRAPDGSTRALALAEDEYIRAHELLKQGHAGVRVVRD
jgi:hypothetical protein